MGRSGLSRGRDREQELVSEGLLRNKHKLFQKSSRRCSICLGRRARVGGVSGLDRWIDRVKSLSVLHLPKNLMRDKLRPEMCIHVAPPLRKELGRKGASRMTHKVKQSAKFNSELWRQSDKQLLLLLLATIVYSSSCILYYYYYYRRLCRLCMSFVVNTIRVATTSMR